MSYSAFRVERNFTQFVVFAEDSILSALSKITANQSRLIFVVSESGILQGVLTDGDFRRWIARCAHIDLNRPVTAAMNPNCRSAEEDSSSGFCRSPEHPDHCPPSTRQPRPDRGGGDAFYGRNSTGQSAHW